MTLRTTLALALAITAAATLAGCGTATGPHSLDDPLIRTDSAEYTLESTDRSWSVEIPYTFFNRTGEDVYLTNCHGGFALRLDRWDEDAGEWVVAWAPVLLLCLSPPIVIRAGDAYQDTVRLFAVHPDEKGGPKFQADEVGGTYRIVWIAASHGYVEGDGGGGPIPLEHRVSNPFVLRE